MTSWKPRGGIKMPFRSENEKQRVEQTSAASGRASDGVSIGKDMKAKSNLEKKKTGQDKGAWGMPWLSEAKKDVTSCEKPRRGANTHRPADLRMGQPAGSDPGITLEA